MVTERLFGDPLRRDHMNFLYSVIKIIDDLDDMVKNDMKNKVYIYTCFFIYDLNYVIIYHNL